ncbi:MAG: CBS domain-containing protein [Candidatus Thermoplasmatota archaeon]|nr:CBS domain-containing protein [Euryarchaeota archaeon]MBU4031602.1 CBS domain-containing protein [Candidatus Thermoplasmatota archaeon]MBU4071756.1 CBS domain-containing protein [Candidatus Thermoplasmatota archaeon]MBU4144922.1 CBS domain-containing protein [Candidatus Thermoplasmatota archaeon]MBU4591677.1 CBS domain-containing protein [Candidatus Thermoplasmatota archaeon]
MKLKDIMVKEVVCAELPGNRTDIIKLMVKNNKTGMPIVKSDGTMAGFINRQDIYAKPDEEQLALLMTKDYPFLGPNDSLEDGARILLDNNLHHLPIVNRKKLVGIVTPADFLSVIEKLDINEPIQNFVRTPCVPIYEGAPIAVADTLFRVANVVAAPVLNDDGRLVGIVTDRDIFKHSNVDGHTAVAELGIGEDEDSWTWEGLRNVIKLYYEVKQLTLPNIPVKKVMVSNPITIFGKTSVSEAARIMKKHDFGQLPIRNSQDRLVAMIYELDMLAAILR